LVFLAFGRDMIRIRGGAY